MPNPHADGNTPARQALRGPTFSLNTRNDNNNSPRSQFASAPRFILPQDGNQASSRTSKDGVDRFRQRTASSPFGRTAPSRAIPPRGTPTPLQRNTAIHHSAGRSNDPEIIDVDDNEEEHENSTERQRDDDSPFEDLFAPPDPNKRRRISPPEIDNEELFPAESQSQDTISSFSENSPPSPAQGRVRYTLKSPFPHHGLPKRRPATETPALSRRRFILAPETPNFGASDHVHITSSQTPAFRSPPRYIVSANYTPSLADEPSTPQAGGRDSGIRSTKKKPAFVLPRSPSPPDPEHGNNSGSPPPAPFSPTSTHSLNRRGRPRSSAALSYLPGGMAEQVRGWILEMGMKREQQVQSRSHSLVDPGRYSFTAKVDSCHNGYLNSSGPVIIVYGTQVVIETNEQDAQSAVAQAKVERNILLLSEPTSRRDNTRVTVFQQTPSRTSLKNGDVIGIHTGLSWEIELDMKEERREPVPRVIASSQSPSISDEDDDDEGMATSSSVPPVISKWLVAAEWDLLMQS